MKHLTLIVLIWVLTAHAAQSQAVWLSSGSGSGNWHDPASWTLTSGSSSTGYPVAGDTATITGTTLTVDSNAQCSALTINSAGTLQFTSILSILTVSNQLTATGAANIDLTLGVLTVTGSMTINGASTLTINEGVLTVIGIILLNPPTAPSTGNSLIDIEGGVFSCAGGMSITSTTATRTSELRINNGAVNMAGELVTISANTRINFTGPGTLTLAGGINLQSATSFIAGNGRVIYFDLPGATQTVAPLSYYRLVIAGTGSGINQITGAVAVTDSLTLLIDTLQITSAGSLTLSDGITIVRTAGQLLEPPTFAGTANLVYNDISRDTTGPEMPASATALQNLTITDISGIDLGANVTVNNNLNLQLGPLWTDDYTLAISNSIGGTTTDPAINRINGYVMGAITRSIGTTTGLRVFPMGADSSQNYREFDLNYTTAPTAAGTLTVMAIDSAAPSQIGLPLTDASETIVNVAPLYWQADAGNGLSGGTYTVTTTATGIPGVTDVSTLRLIKRPSTGGPWTAPGTPGTNSGTNATPIVTRSGLSGFSQFAIGSDLTNTLPINLVAFSGQAAGNKVTLLWTTSGEVSNESFIIGHSTDGSSFTDLATVSGAGSSSGSDVSASASEVPQSYNYTQQNAPAGANYYRLQLVAPNGQSTYSSIISVSIVTGTSWSLYPNPSNGVLNIVSPAAGSTSPAAGSTTFQLYDNSGRFLRTLSVGANDVSPLAPGLYFVRSQQGVMIFVKN